MDNLINSRSQPKGCKREVTSGVIQFDDFLKVDLRVAQIKKVEEIEGADKLYKLTVDLGELGKRIILAGIKEHYSKDELKNKKIVVVVNLAPRKMRGIESHGMLLAASIKEEGKCVLLTIDQDILNGTKIG